MKKSLLAKFIGFYILLGFIGIFVVSMVGSALVSKHLKQVYSSELYKEATSIAENRASLYYKEQATLDSVESNLKTLSSYQQAEIWLISPQGEILLNTSKEADTGENETIKNFNPGKASGSYYQVGRFYGTFSEPQLSVMVPVTWKMNIQGYVAMHLPMNILEKQQNETMNIVYLLTLLLFLVMLLVLVIFIFMVYRPLRQIITGADRFASGDLKYNIPVSTHDELGYLALTLNYMSDELDTVGDYQRKFVANVSHDFRSPLTSIKGYTEAILDGTIPPELQEKYLNIVVFETDRLYKLTQSLLTLNDMDDKGRMLEYSNFDINGIIKSISNTFEGICTEKRISISLLLTGQTLFVSADMGKIQQVLYNLIDNAIKFSLPDSEIKVETTIKHETVFVSVKDSGCGIPKSSLTKIWDRFYKIDSSRGKDRKGTGLGLSIVKEIVHAHNQHINVISTEHVGTEFIFTLTKGSQSN